MNTQHALNPGAFVTPNLSKRLRKAMGVRGRKAAKRYRQWLRSDSPLATQAREGIANAAQIAQDS